MRRLALLAVAAAAVAGCGNERTEPPDVRTPLVGDESRTVRMPDAGVTFTAPLNWDDVGPTPPLAGGIASGSAAVAVWRYPRTEPLPADRTELDAARERLIKEIKARNPTFAVRTSELTRIGDARAIELTGRQTVSGTLYDVRSAHVFEGGAELVVDAIARPVDFATVDAQVFVPLLDSLEFTGAL